MGRTRILVSLLSAMILVGFGVWAFMPRAIQVETAPVISGRFTAAVEETGRTRVRERYVVSSPLAARLTRPSLRPGDAVEMGQAIATLRANASSLLDPRARQELEERIGMAEASLEEASAAQERARVLLARARSDLDRTRQLRATGAAALTQFERDTFAFEAAERDLVAADRRRHAAEHAVAQMRALIRPGGEGNGDTFTLSAPVAGRVLKITQESEGVVAAGAPVMEIGDPLDIEVAVDLLTTVAVLLREGAPVSISGWGGATRLPGRVRRVEPSGFTKLSALGVEEQRVWVLIDIIAPPAQRAGLADGFRVEVTITLDEIEGATLIPAGALFRRGDDWFVFVAAGGKALLRRVELRQRSGRTAAVAAGLTPGERVIVYPPSAVADGKSVRDL
ncbi:MAG: HlyD family secretion protein [Xanthobacteraceae bacterium]|nr:MAG: HlyD family secretion protein [Xanthobacteraceae bacterium]